MLKSTLENMILENSQAIKDKVLVADAKKMFTDPNSPIRHIIKHRDERFQTPFHDLLYTATTYPVVFDGPIWESSYSLMYPMILRDHFGDFNLNGHSLRDVIDALIELRREFKKKMALAHLAKLRDYPDDGIDYNKAQWYAKAILCFMYGRFVDDREFDVSKFVKIAKSEYDRAAISIISSGGILLNAQVDTFVYAAEAPITFSETQHNDKYSKIVIFEHGYIADPGKMRRVRLCTEKIKTRLLKNQRQQFIKE
ncbi:hypothetical protein [Aeromonas phage SW69-9]|uniref:Uncharacterized protein n=2 Tax=Biquartavirus 44RR2 TaxID=115987 RepID=Q6U9D1_9CAUD|nr:hypothetical protein ST44RRORF171c [Aeromonas phage 44RR2.8t]AAQ81489.1 hypothetical protein 44RRORF171c [Aeromonas phage 44RR2.8t]APU00643.1 hypothetical protein [Aeromonas phage 44RR2.8t.2]APU02471.1 hypothetical protein [Aeromonas phage SW69-9]